MKEEQVLLKLIKKDCEINGSADESRLAKMASLMNIHPEKYQKIVEALIESKKVERNGKAFLLV